MEIGQSYIRPLRPWRIVTADIRDARIVFERTIYNRDRKPDHKTTEFLDFSQTDISEYIRLCLITYIMLGKISPPHVQQVLNEYKVYHCDAGNPEAPKSLREFLSRMDDSLPGILDDPMQGVLTRPFHENLFGSDRTLMDALEFSHSTQGHQFKEIFELYFKSYIKCRQYIIDMAFSMARDTPSLTHAEIHSGEEFFSWWKRRCNREIRIKVSEDKIIPLYLPGIPERSITMLTRVIQDIANDYRKLASLLGRPEAAREFILDFGIELNEGMVNLPLNQYGKEMCPAAKDMEIRMESSKGYPTRASHIKDVFIAGHVVEDAFKRFFSANYKRFLLPRTQSQIVVCQLGSCPFPDYGFLDADMNL